MPSPEEQKGAALPSPSSPQASTAGRSAGRRALEVIRSPRWHRRLGGAVAIVLAVWALAWLAVPPIARSQIEKIASARLGRQVTVDAVGFKPWSLEITVEGFKVARAASGNGFSPGTPQLAVKRLYIDAELASLLRLAPVADAIVVDEPVLHLTHLGDGRYDIDDVVQKLQPAEDTPPGEPMHFALYNLVLSGGRVDFDDRAVGKVHALRGLELPVPFLSNLDAKREITTAPHLAFTLNGSHFDTAAVGTPFARTRKTDATLSLQDVDLAPYLGYLPAGLPFRLQSAVLQADLKIAFEQTPATVVRISGGLTAERVVLATGQGGKLLAFDRLRVGLDDVRPLDRVVRLSTVELTAPTLDVARDRAGRLNLMPSASTAGAGQSVAAATPPPATAASAAVPPAAVAAPVAIAQAANAAVGAAGSSAASAASAAGGATGVTGIAAVMPPVTASTSPAASVPTTAATTTAPPTSPWQVRVAQVHVKAGRVRWQDEALASPARVDLDGLMLEATAIAVPFTPEAPLRFSGAFSLANPPAPAATTAPARRAKKGDAAGLAVAAAPARAGKVSFSGTATDRAATLQATVASWPLGMAARYVGQFLLPALNGQLDGDIGVDWQAAGDGKPQVLHVTAPRVALGDVQLAEGRNALVSVRRVALAQVDIDVTGQRFRAASLQLDTPRARVERGSDQRWMYERWLVGSGSPAATALPAPPPAATPRPPPTAAQARATAPSWAVAIDEVQLDGGAVSFSDQSRAKPVAFEVSAAKARLGKLVLDDRSGARPPMPLTASLRLASGRFEPGRLDFNGSLGLAPLQAQGRLVAERLPLQAFEPYVAESLNVELLRADASFKGRLAWRDTPAGPQAKVSGDVALEDFRANTLAPSEDLLAWKALQLRGLDVTLAPAQATRVDVRETVLTDFFARVIVMPTGRINLQDLVKPAAGTGAGTGTAPTTVPAPDTRTARGSDGAQVTAQVAPPAGVAAPAAAGPAPVVNFGPMSLVGGKVLFSDRFVKPNYSADLSELTGKLSAFSSVAGPASAPAMADLELRGKAESTASLEILGKLNPLAKPLALDIKGKVRDLELPPLSPYSVKYSAYGITRGKLDVDVAYRVQPDGRLTAANKVVLNQLSFGEKDPNSTASLPVKLAVALLADRNGVIDIDLPISGSLNDPQFSLGPVIVKVILNVIVKAITAPFSLLAGAFGGGADELGMVGFAPGSAALAPEARASLDRIARSLTDRPALRLTVTGTSSLEAERDGFQHERLAELVQAEKRRQTVKDGGAATAAVTVSADEYPALLKQVYERADMPKPRNLVGLLKAQPVPDMEKLLLADIRVSDDAIRELAVRRGVAVKDYLAGRGLPPERLFLGAARAVPPEAKWTPRAELNLATP